MLLRNLKFYRIQNGPGNMHVQFEMTKINKFFNFFFIVLQVSRSSSNASLSDVQQQSADESVSGKQIKPERKSVVPSNYRFVYPEFLPDPKMEWRNALREKLERMDMIQRRKHLDIPEFYVGM